MFPRGANETEEFSFKNIKPTKDLQYHPCGSFQCARLEVPLDWSQPTKNSTAAIAIVKLPATVPEDDPSFAGSIFINPGGPSGSGTGFTYSFGPALQKLLGGERNYEIIGFDPRGVNMSTPHADCYKGDYFSRKLDSTRADGMSPIDEALGYHWAAASAKSELCEEDGVDSIFGHMNTASVARDMVEMADRIDELRWKNSNKTKPADAEKPRVQYFGISYGSYLGNTFASMFPERIGRVLIDAVIDGEDWVTGAFKNNINDAETIVDLFYATCFEAGEDCPLLESSDTSAADIKGRVTEFLEELDLNPIPLSLNNRAVILTSPNVRQAIFSALYNPLTDFEILASGLDALLSGNYTAFIQILPADSISLVCDAPDSPGDPLYVWGEDVLAGVLCTDIDDSILDRNISFYEDLVEYHKDQSPTAGPSVSGAIPITCANRKIRPPYAFTGPFTSPAANPDDPKAPAAPLLITSSRYDPITPLRNALTVQKGHTGSSVVIQEGAGHGMISGPSQCIIKIIREFFYTGKVPESGTICEAECIPTIPADKNNCTDYLEARDGERFVMPKLDEWHWF
ncbi:hypothetical protein CkaCkLH20_12323 [Colletotrichum karsti]|uniref:Peptidase S33 tripeptidyl aminopeptidase-like C-terminal domain-containing protein n=1 Tax=Colletotrichum karsti TaxID=1095194 RepID=A0A9P6HSW2_9PEZI|nr:uncharacterized protein CkaCkLH20_12323 [Colletotrichum karsti]KAF9870237.1 hypothetical protein CkaCkLH20_12323 [Colletotrichum karsti]